MRHAALTAVALVVGAAVFALSASQAMAHPLGNFSINHLSEVRVSDDRVQVLYVLDQAEIPTFEERGRSPGEVLAAKRAEVERGLRLEVDGRSVPLRAAAPGRIGFLEGQGGLKTTRVELELEASVDDPRAVVLRDGTFEDRLGWKAIVSAPGEDTAVRTDAPSGDPTDRLRRYPEDLLDSPLDRREASFSVEPGDGALVAPRSERGETVTTRNGSGEGFAGLFADAASGEGVLLLLLVSAFGWGAFHALSPGHGKAMVAAYLVGARGTAKHAVALGGIVTVTHTIGVFALGLVTLALSQYVLPEDLYPWLTMVSGLLVVVVGLGVLRSRFRWMRRQREHAHHHHDHDHDHDHDHSHMPNEVTWKGLLGMGASAGLIPCPSALVVLLAAIAQHQVGLGLVLILAFSLGLAMTLTALGLLVVYARGITSRIGFGGRVASALPSLSAIVIVGIGLVLTAQAIPQVA